MKFFLYTWYFLRSVILRGPLNTLSLLVAEGSEENRYGIQTGKIKHSASSRFFHYQGAGYLVLNRIFRQLGPMPGFRFTDIGCGKGRVLCVAEHAGFNHLTGIELDEELITEAQKNVDVCKTRRATSYFELIRANALEVNYPNQKTVYFFFNPFNEEVLEKVIARILQTNAPETWFVYMNPLYAGAFDRAGIPLIHRIKTGFYTEALIYRHTNNQIIS